MDTDELCKRIVFLKNELHKRGLYKYVCDDEIIYIGRSHTSILTRIKNHESEPKFQPYLQKSQIFFLPLDTDAQTTAAEAMLIEKYKPVLNVQYNTDAPLLFDIEPFLPEWRSWDEIQEIQTELVCLQKIESDARIAATRREKMDGKRGGLIVSN